MFGADPLQKMGSFFDGSGKRGSLFDGSGVFDGSKGSFFESKKSLPFIYEWEGIKNSFSVSLSTFRCWSMRGAGRFKTEEGGRVRGVWCAVSSWWARGCRRRMCACEGMCGRSGR